MFNCTKCGNNVNFGLYDSSIHIPVIGRDEILRLCPTCHERFSKLIRYWLYNSKQLDKIVEMQ